ncbi:Uncharacterised protein [Mycobacteroides abscessus subsp. abscessus]|nr:Uncharacterised protein [Mycobacteroides abscessus subsp. abscessus]
MCSEGHRSRNILHAYTKHLSKRRDMLAAQRRQSALSSGYCGLTDAQCKTDRLLREPSAAPQIAKCPHFCCAPVQIFYFDAHRGSQTGKDSHCGLADTNLPLANGVDVYPETCSEC